MSGLVIQYIAYRGQSVRLGSIDVIDLISRKMENKCKYKFKYIAKNQAKYQLIEEGCICLGSKYVAK